MQGNLNTSIVDTIKVLVPKNLLHFELEDWYLWHVLDFNNTMSKFYSLDKIIQYLTNQAQVTKTQVGTHMNFILRQRQECIDSEEGHWGLSCCSVFYLVFQWIKPYIYCSDNKLYSVLCFYAYLLVVNTEWRKRNDRKIAQNTKIQTELSKNENKTGN